MTPKPFSVTRCPTAVLASPEVDVEHMRCDAPQLAANRRVAK
eukprot:CAMPEP_0174842832 /NCGR_PEP_ID=MMETSP1114-20130205/10151_1 /TAXON_ID=312471 /ORGANISM="Neobodo designis, Strain CCAP 1951/1" /LENGTH=41 /DNA_ID= /DNA_START= /DNA_END= /DNA_ORIENTATION=